MIMDWFSGNDGWAWMVVGLALLGAELVMPGVLLMWIGFAAVAVGLVSLIGLSDLWWDWRAQAIVFAALAFLFAIIGSRVQRRGPDDEAERLGRPGLRLVGRTATLAEPIENGIGRARLGDTLWRVAGPDLPSGARVTVTGEADGTLTVEPAA